MIGDNSVTEYIRKTIRRNNGLLAEIEKYAAENHVPIVQPEVARLLAVLGSIIKPERTLEVGTAIGYSSIIMAGFLQPGGRIDTIDRNELVTEKARENIARAGLGSVISIITGDALDVLQCLDKRYDLIFLDAAKGQYIEFLPDCMRMLKPGGVMISDNVLYKGMIANDELVVRRKKTIVTRMRAFLDEICSNDELDTSVIPIGDGVAISYRKDVLL